MTKPGRDRVKLAPTQRAVPCQVPCPPPHGSDSVWPAQSGVLFQRDVLNPELGPQASSISALGFLCCYRSVLQLGSRCDEREMVYRKLAVGRSFGLEIPKASCWRCSALQHWGWTIPGAICQSSWWHSMEGSDPSCSFLAHLSVFI